ncbi:MAG: hypothetical protein AB9915_02945 [Candidatus Dojkabacteria bacterium]
MEKSGIELLPGSVKYHLKGGYSGEQAGVFEGEIYCLPDGKIVGYMIDCNDPNKFRLVLGSKDEESIKYWKMQPLQNKVYPVVCVLQKNSPTIYSGQWIAFNNLEEYTEMLSTIPEITEALFLEEEKAIKLLASIEKERLDSYLPQVLIDDINRHGNPCFLSLEEEI